MDLIWFDLILCFILKTVYYWRCVYSWYSELCTGHYFCKVEYCWALKGNDSVSGVLRKLDSPCWLCLYPAQKCHGNVPWRKWFYFTYKYSFRTSLKAEYLCPDTAFYIINSVSFSASLYSTFHLKKSMISSSLSSCVVMMPTEWCRKNVHKESGLETVFPVLFSNIHVPL